MPANFESGFCVRVPSWHRQEVLLQEYPKSWEEARVPAGLTWDPIEVPDYGYKGIDVEGQPAYSPETAIAGDFFADPDRKRIIRNDTGATLAVANQSYTIIDHTEMGEIVDAVLQQEGIKYETAGAIEEGKGVWALALLDEPVTLKGDFTETLPYVAMLNRHDGGGAFSVTATAVRVVCANTWKLAELQGKKNGTTYSFKHTKNWKDRAEEAREAIRGVRNEFTQYCELAEELLGITVTERQAELFIASFIPEPPAGLRSNRVMGNITQARAHIKACLYSSTTAEVSHTAYGLVQAAGEYSDHIKKARSWETRLNRSLLSVERTKSVAVKIAREVAMA